MRGSVSSQSVVDKAELIKWWDVQDLIHYSANDGAVEGAVAMARECRHPDAQWLASLFPAGTAVRRDSMRRVMLEQGHDPRALFIASRLSSEDRTRVVRAAEMGYAPAQAIMASTAMADHSSPSGRLAWAESASSQGDRRGLFMLAGHYARGRGCIKNVAKAKELYREAAELGDPAAQVRHGELSFGPLDWERFHWWGLAATRNFIYTDQFFCAIGALLPSFERGENGRILHTVVPVVRNSANLRERLDSVFCFRQAVTDRLLGVHDAMLGRARAAIACWAAVARRLGLVKDMRVMIGKMAWEEPWRWGGKAEAIQEEESAKRRRSHEEQTG
jgi:hypothetical protein